MWKKITKGDTETIKQVNNNTKSKRKETLSVLSLFSGCGGMDLGFEGGFAVLEESINEKLTPPFHS